MKEIAALCMFLFSSFLLAGCPVPIPPTGHGNSRQNIPESVEGTIVPGKTTRDEVVLRLGEPDGLAIDGSWLCYGNFYRYGGVIFVAGGGGAIGGAGLIRVLYTRLIVPFDTCGVAIKPIFESKICSEYIGFVKDKGGTSEPCMDITGKDIYLEYGLNVSRD